MELARSEERPLIFLFVADPGPLQAESFFGSGPAASRTLLEEMAWTGRVLLRIARFQALRAGVDAEIVVRVGNVKVEIEKCAIECEAAMVLLGAPRGASADISADSPVSRLARAIRDSSGVEVLIVAPGLE